MASDPTHLPKPDVILTTRVCDLFLSHPERHNARAADLGYRHVLQSFCELYGRLGERVVALQWGWPTGSWNWRRRWAR